MTANNKNYSGMDKVKMKHKYRGETISEEDMVPSKFEPIFNRLFVFYVERIDPFLVNDLIRSSWKKTTFLGQRRKGRLVVTLHEAICPSAIQQVREWLQEGFWKSLKGRTAELKFLDRVGTVIQHTVYEGVRLKEVILDPVSYDSKDTVKIRLVLDYKREKLIY